MASAGPSATRSKLAALVQPEMVALHVFAVVAIAFCAVAGYWQLDVYQAEQDADRAEQASAAPAPLAETLGSDEGLTNELVGARVVADGQYAPADQQILVANRTEDGRDGYWVVSPLLVDSGSAMLVVRGWTPEQSVPPVPKGPVSVTGSLEASEERSGMTGASRGASRVVDSVRIPALVGELPYDLYGAFLVRTGEEPAPRDGLTPVDAPTPEPSWTTGLRNLAYALQWWIFAAFGLFMWWRLCADRVRGDASRGDGGRRQGDADPPVA